MNKNSDSISINREIDRQTHKQMDANVFFNLYIYIVVYDVHGYRMLGCISVYLATNRETRQIHRRTDASVFSTYTYISDVHVYGMFRMHFWQLTERQTDR